jgi:Ku protein
MLDKDGARLKQQYVSEKDQHVVERAEMVKGYEFEKDRFVIFQPEELKALQESPSHTIDIVAFIPDKAIDPIFYDKAYYLAPDKRGGKPYNLLIRRCARAAGSRSPSGRGRPSSTSSRCGPPKTASSCSSCSTPTKCAR